MRKIDYFFLAPTLIILSILIVLPLVSVFHTSFTDRPTYSFERADYVGLSNYLELLRHERFWNSIRITIVLAFSTVILQVVFGLMVALLLKKQNMVYSYLGLIDTHIGGIVIYLSFNLTLVAWSMRAFFDQIPRDLEEAAYIDGASHLYTFWKIILPLSAPGAAATAVLCLIISWNEFVYALLLTQMKAMTAPVAVVIFASEEAFDWGLVSAGSITLTLPVLLFSILVRRYLVFGLLGGSLKE